MLDQRGVELDPRHHPGVGAGGREGDDDLAADRRHQHRLGDRRVGGQGPDVEPEVIAPEIGEEAQGPRGQAVAAGLVPGEGGLVDDQGVEPEAPGLDPRRDPCGTGADDQDVCHPATVSTFRTAVPIAARIRSSGGATGSSARPDAERPNEHRSLREADPRPGGPGQARG